MDRFYVHVRVSMSVGLGREGMMGAAIVCKYRQVRRAPVPVGMADITRGIADITDNTWLIIRSY